MGDWPCHLYFLTFIKFFEYNSKPAAGQCLLCERLKRGDARERQDMSEHGTDANLDTLPEEIAETTANTLAAIGFRIRELRQLRGRTLQELADVSGLSTSMLSLVERGRASP